MSRNGLSEEWKLRDGMRINANGLVLWLRHDERTEEQLFLFENLNMNSTITFKTFTELRPIETGDRIFIFPGFRRNTGSVYIHVINIVTNHMSQLIFLASAEYEWVISIYALCEYRISLTTIGFEFNHFCLTEATVNKISDKENDRFSGNRISCLLFCNDRPCIRINDVCFKIQKCFKSIYIFI